MSVYRATILADAPKKEQKKINDNEKCFIKTAKIVNIPIRGQGSSREEPLVGPHRKSDQQICKIEPQLLEQSMRLSDTTLILVQTSFKTC